MSPKYFNGWFVMMPIMVASLISSSLCTRVLEWFGFASSVLSHIVAGTLIGAPIGITIWLVMVLVSFSFHRGDK